MDLMLEKFVMEEKIKTMSRTLIDTDNDIQAYNLLKNISTTGELRKLKALIHVQKRDIGNNFTAIAIYISTIALVLPALERLLSSSAYIIISSSLAIGLGYSIYKDGVPIINKNDELNSKIDYLLWLIDEEINCREVSAD
jgi:hypothetical protein